MIKINLHAFHEPNQRQLSARASRLQASCRYYEPNMPHVMSFAVGEICTVLETG